MELITEDQRPPFLFACLITLVTVVASYFMARYLAPSATVANLWYWYMARSAGFTAYGMLAAAVLLGLTNSTGFWDAWRLRKLMNQMHQYLSLLVFPFLFFHLWGLHQDTTVPFGWVSLFAPFVTRYRPIPIGLGILTLYGWTALILTSYIREKIGVKWWRGIHYGAFPMFVGVSLHGIFAGTDTSKPWSIVIYLVPLALFALLVRRRLGMQKRSAAGRV